MAKDEADVREAMTAINRAWQSGQPSAMAAYLHPDIVMKLPGFSGTVAGRDKLIAGFEDFCTNARVLEYHQSDQQLDLVDDCAVVSARFDMRYERGSYRGRSGGRDVWVFTRAADRWVAVWRTMVDLSESSE
jgi:ketosteroid isomerase-like protein